MALPSDTTKAVKWDFLTPFEIILEEELKEVKKKALVGPGKRESLAASYDKKIAALEAIEKDVKVNNPLVANWETDKKRINDLSGEIEKHEEEFNKLESSSYGNPWYQRLFNAYDPKSPNLSTSILGEANKQLSDEKVELYGLQKKWFSPSPSMHITSEDEIGDLDITTNYEMQINKKWDEALSFIPLSGADSEASRKEIERQRSEELSLTENLWNPRKYLLPSTKEQNPNSPGVIIDTQLNLLSEQISAYKAARKGLEEEVDILKRSVVGVPSSK